MRASELRIGNLILDQSTGKECTVDAIDLRGTMFTEDKTYDDHQRWIKPAGISLTEEWLLRFGFDPTDNYGHYFTQAQYVIYHCKINKISGRAAIGIATFDDDGYRNGFVNFAWDLQYVHQLQNLYFALTGEELTLKEKV